MKHRTQKILVVLFMLFTLAAFTYPVHGGPAPKKIRLSNYSSEVIFKWNAIGQEVMQGATYNPLLASRIQAMMHLAMHDALNGIAPVFETYALKERDKKADPIAAASTAAYTVLLESFPDKKEQLDRAMTEVLKDVKSADALERGRALGTNAAKGILDIRNSDGAFGNPVGKNTNPEEPGLYQTTPPMPFVYAPFWTTMKPFALTSPDQFRIAPMPSLSSEEYAIAFNEVKQKGCKENSTRTAEETAIAKFWYEFSEIGWNRVAITAARDAKLDLLTTARLLALVNMALADGYTAGWDSKFHYNFWRPYTAIRKASTDNNEKTVEDEAWEPLMGTPPVHDYPSTHSVLGGGAATVLSEILGENTGFTMTSTSAETVGYMRTFKSFKQAAIENGDSRVYAGIHFRFSCDAGVKQGEQIGKWILKNSLKEKSKGKNL